MTSTRKQWRRQAFICNKQGRPSRTKGHFTVRVNPPVYDPIYTKILYVDSWPVDPSTGEIDSDPLGYIFRRVITLERALVCYDHVCATDGAERSSPWRGRRKRGLRKGKRRSRVRQTRRSAPSRQPLPNTQRARYVNHVGRKFIWAVSTSNKFSRKCRRYQSIPPVAAGCEDQPFAIRKRTFRKSLEKRWSQLFARAQKLGIPPSAAFHRSFREYIGIECSRSTGAFMELLEISFPKQHEESELREELALKRQGKYFAPPASLDTTSARGSSSRGVVRGARGRGRAGGLCRQCGSFHAVGACAKKKSSGRP